MCISATLVALMVGGSLLSGASSALSAAVQAETANQQLKMDIEVERIKATTDMADRLNEYAQVEARNRVSMAAMMGGATNLSFETGIIPANNKVAQRDVARIQYNSDMEVARKRYGIAVNNASISSSFLTGTLDQAGSYLGAIGGKMLNSSSAAPLAVQKVGA